MPQNAVIDKFATGQRAMVREAGRVLAGICIACCLCLVLSGPAFGRFLDADRDEVDREELLNSENYNDEISYRQPIYWEHLFETHDIGVRVNGGSYNARRFMYEEDIKLISPRDRLATFSFLQEREHNLLGNFNDRQFRVTLNALKPAYLSVLADGDSLKKNADLGTAIGYEFSRGQTLELYYWSVNHLYNNKRDADSRNKIERPTKTWGGQYYGLLPAGMTLRLRSEIDTPYRFNARDQGYVYEYEQRNHSVLLSHGSKANGHYWDLRWQQGLKRESKDFRFTAATGVKKALSRETEWIEGRYSYGEENLLHWTSGLLYLARNANYTWHLDGVTEEQAEDTPEPHSPSILRNEAGAYSTFFQRIPVDGWRNTGYQFGLFLNSIRFNRDGAIRTANEVKAQAAWTIFFTDTVQMFWNATFNVDGLYKNYPYNEKPFKPWDGGALNILAVF